MAKKGGRTKVHEGKAKNKSPGTSGAKLAYYIVCTAHASKKDSLGKLKLFGIALRKKMAQEQVAKYG